jgi:hypothetical protein
VFGEINDVYNYFNYKLSNYNCTREERLKLTIQYKNKYNVMEYQERLAPEILFAKNYVSKANTIKIDETVKGYWDFVKNNTICVSHDEVQLSWPKYKSECIENFINMSYLPKDNKDQCLCYTWNFSNWLGVYTGRIRYNSSYERISTLKATTIIGGI